MRILVVDDEPLVARTLSLVFRRHGFEVDAVHNAEDALTQVSTLPPDLILCDIDMPRRDGVSLMYELGERIPGCPILVLTGFYSSIARVRACAETLPQPVSIITKPCQPLELLRAADDMLKTA